jgi:presenilin-like A22 family membrane protease
MSGPQGHVDKHFRPLRPASGVRLATAIVLGPVVWVIAFIATSAIFEQSDAIELGLLVAMGSFVVGFVVLFYLRWRRDRERRRYERG